jgi:hypothetical protein
MVKFRLSDLVTNSKFKNILLIVIVLISALAIYTIYCEMPALRKIFSISSKEGFNTRPETQTLLVEQGANDGLANVGQYVTGNARIDRITEIEDSNPFFNFARQCEANPSCSACNGVCESTGKYVGILNGSVVTGNCNGGRILEGEDCEYYVAKAKCDGISHPNVATETCGVCVDFAQLELGNLQSTGVVLDGRGNLAFPKRE